jgi:hypothetical protein
MLQYPAGFAIYRVIQKGGFNFLSLYLKIRTNDRYDVNYI